ncbi:hypothetical protein [Escherichia albertii]|uniref:hypothetical protein n=1 Tax=Escherichia albertii TaxID=208962 RepID=UPI003F48444E
MEHLCCSEVSISPLFRWPNSVCHFKKHKDRDQKVEVLYGYPANSTTWLTIYHYRKSGRWVFEWDDLFADKRPKSWGDISECLMFEERKSGATREEFNEAWARLSERGYQ